MAANAPCNLEAERSIIASLLIDAETLHAARCLKPETFSDSKMGEIFRAALELDAKKFELDILTLSAELEGAKKLDYVGGQEELLRLMGEVPSSANIDSWVRLVLESWCRRELMKTCAKAQAAAADAAKPFMEICAGLETATHAAASAAVPSADRTAGETLANALDEIQEAYDDHCEGRESKKRVLHRVDWVDSFIKVYRRGLHTYAAQTGHGKTALELQCFGAQALAGDHVVLGCTESTAEELMTRLVAARAQVSMEEAIEPTSKESVLRMRKAAAEIARVKDNFIIWGEDDFDSDIDKFCYLVMGAWRKWGKLDMFWLDHFADINIPESDSDADRFKGVRLAVLALKRLAIKTNAAGTILTQFNKDAEDLKHPTLKTFTGSAHYVRPMRLVSVLRNLDYKAGEERKELERCEWYSLKARFGKGFFRYLTFKGSEGRFFREAREVGEGGNYEHKYTRGDEPDGQP